ncbi:MAG TPA: RDD family protein [Bryobacteraceae bacterium]|nr:RDD family protein [Bryobacteraceae bacterium]
MECRYCQFANAEDDHRCRRCGRRLQTGPVYTSSSAAAPVLHREASPVLHHETAPVLHQRTAPALVHTAPEPVEPRRAITYQPSLFSSREVHRIVPFESIAPGVVQHSPRKTQTSAPRQRPRKVIPGQQALEFTQSARASKPADGVIYCDAPVAVPAHRVLAAAVDTSIMLIALAIFGTIFHLAGGAFVVSAKTAPMFVAAAVGIVVFYRLLWCLANGDTAGQSWTRLRLVNFDGQRPTRTQRFYRLASGFLSLLAAGIGLLWSLVDEETLTWHDHISKTFPTPVN